ncbi:hypothetical protein ASF10_23775 [Flavobacterium sp. Leaf82]|nr:hypothetical protein ASF10_23775 [Flavobacterium sp. Leaf82]
MVGEFLIESKKGKYRVSVFNIKFFVEPIGLSSGGLSMQSISEYTIEKSLLKKNGAIRETSLGYNLTGGLSMQSISEYTIEKSLLKKNGAIRETSLGYNLTETLNPHLTEVFLINKNASTDW